ncbi:zinc finger protein Rlf [Rhinatrema bivittatum]|uniref:zinc finger protein Rlf n=1 Tax=Rhinatrema bivittatum TaxID=194408 RepID=UPI00112DE93F|nr:zinc finger protein Rlf [Rhinatrema bivittatum]
MADGEGDCAAERGEMALAPGLQCTLRELESELRKSEVSESSSRSYCRSFCQILLQYADNQNASEHILPLLEVYRISIQSFACARPFLTTECEDVLLVLGRLVLSCFELLLSVPDNELSYEVWLQFQQSLQNSHDALLEFGNNNLKTLVDITKEGGIWKNPLYLKILSQQPVEVAEVNTLITQEGPSFLQLRIKHLMKSNCISQAATLAKLCAESSEISNASSFRQSYITCLCTMLPNEEAIKEISKVDCKEVLDIICNLESEGHDNTAFILCTTYLTQQLQTENLDCSWELTLFWSKLQRRIDPSLDSFLERCRQFGVLAKTLPHLFFLIRVVHAEAEEVGLSVSVLLCMRALQIKSNENDEMKTSVCKTISCLLSEDLEVKRACQLTEFLLEPTIDAYNMLEELYLQPDQKCDEENAQVPNSLRCELLLALKAHWPFDPEFWDWKTLKRQCLKLLGIDASESEENESCNEMPVNEADILEKRLSDYEGAKELPRFRHTDINQQIDKTKVKKPVGSSERYQRWLQYKFYCVMCKREVIEARILHHSKMHLEDGIYTCPVCLKKVKKKEAFVTHVMEHVKMPLRQQRKKKLLVKKEHRISKSKRRLSSASAVVEESSQLCDQTTNDPLEYVMFSHIEDYHLQDKDLYPCPGTDCSRVFKQFKYLSVHLKAEHQSDDENVKHYLEMKNRREKCSFCRRHFMSRFHLQKHEKVHFGPDPFMCVSIGCFARFDSVNALLSHKQTHDDLRYKCELNGCNIVFSDLAQLYHHEAQHFRDASYACTFLGCKKFYYSKTEFQDHLITHNLKEKENQIVIHSDESTTNDKEIKIEQVDLPQNSDVHGALTLFMDPANDQVIPQIKEEHTSQEINEANHRTLLENRDSGTFKQKQISVELIGKGESTQAVTSTPVSSEKNKLSCLREKCSKPLVCFDGKKFTCGYEGCGFTCKTTRIIQKHLRKFHPQHFKIQKKSRVETKSFIKLFNDSQKSNSTKKIGTGTKRSFKTNTSFQNKRIACTSNSRRKSALKKDTDHLPQETSLSHDRNVPVTEDVILELLSSLKHLSLQNSTKNCSTHRPVSTPLQTGAASPKPVNETVLRPHSQEHQENVSSQYLIQLAAKPFFCELQGCTYEFVTRQALLMHYVKKHNYSREKVLQLSKFKYRYSPFQCHICHSAFTRRTHLRIHYKNKHQLSNSKVTGKIFTASKFSANMREPAVRKLKNRSRSYLGSAFRKREAKELGKRSGFSEQQLKRAIHRPSSQEYYSETDIDSMSEETETNFSRKSSELSPLDSHADELEAREGRGSKRTVAKGNLCYMLNKYHKPFHCINKNCNSSFTTQKGLVRHYRTVHRYNREQLCLEEDKARTKREFVKCKKIFVCKYKDCTKRFMCNRTLAKHDRDVHSLDNESDQKVLSLTESAKFSCNQPKGLAMFYTCNKLKPHQVEDHSAEGEIENFEIPCGLNGCDRHFTHYGGYSQHVYCQHREYYDDLFGRLGEGEVEEVEEDLKRDSEQDCVKENRQCDINQDKKPTKSKAKTSGSKLKRLLQFKTREDAQNMCSEEIKHTQFPCMVQGCLSVVKLESSIVRHYKRTHHLEASYVDKHYHKLIMCVKYDLEIKMKPCSEKKLYLKRKKVIHFVQKNMTHPPQLCESGENVIQNDYCVSESKEIEDQETCVAENNMISDTDALLCRNTLDYNHNSNTACFEDSPLCKVEESLHECSVKENKSDFCASQSPLKRKREEDDDEQNSEHEDSTSTSLSASKEKYQKHSLTRSIDLKSFKPMGFESSFLKFIQESEERDDDFDEDIEWEQAEHSLTDDMENEREDDNSGAFRTFADGKPEITIPQTKNGSAIHEKISAIQPLLSSIESPTVPSLQNLRDILDKALNDCGDLALKQLHYLRPVVVLERSKFSTSLIDLFPSKKTDDLCVGSS